MPYVPYTHHADFTAPKFTSDHLDRLMAGHIGGPTEPKRLTRLQNFAAAGKRGFSAFLCLAMANWTVPQGAIVAYGIPMRDALTKYRTEAASKAKDLARRRAKSDTRLLTFAEQNKMQGKSGENPYLAGQQKWDINYKGVDMFTGNFSTSATDLSFESGYGIPVNVTRSYSANDPDEGPFGKGWTLSADVRTTAGGLLKSARSPVLAVPTQFHERPPAETDPNVATQPAEAVVATDSGGKAETIQKDADGILTTPPWDNNTSNPTYQFVTFGGQIYQVLAGDTVTTMDGTVYAYQNMGNYPNGERPWNTPTEPAVPTNVLKVTSATDRQGNVTTYTYNTSATVTFWTANGYVTENPLISVQMPNGHAITFTWGDGVHAPTNRVWTVADNNNSRVVTYGYTNGLLTSVTTPGGKTTTYGYGSAATPSGWQADDASGLLTTITDPRGLATVVNYTMAAAYVTQNGYFAGEGVVVSFIQNPNGAFTGFSFSPASSPFTGVGGSATEFTAEQWNGNPFSSPYISTSSFTLVVWPGSTTVQRQSFLGVVHSYGAWRWPTETDLFDPNTENELDQVSFSLWPNEFQMASDQYSLARARFLAAPVDPQGETCTYFNSTEVASTFNFVGNPLSQTTIEYANSSQTVSYRTAEVDYAYWDSAKYYEQKATHDVSANRYTYTDYFPSTAPAGERGQKSYVWDPAYGQIYLDPNASIPPYMQNDKPDWWKYQVTAPANTYAAAFAYDSLGRCSDVWKLQSATTNSWKYVQTHTDYDSSGSPSWGAARDVIEDYGGINRTTTNHGYTSWGKPNDVTDGAGHEFFTQYDGDEVVQQVTEQTANGLVPIVTYQYNSNAPAPGTVDVTYGQVSTVTDGLSGRTETFGYTSLGGGIGQVASVSEEGGGAGASTVTCVYDEIGNRSTVTYSGPSSAATTWQYADYMAVGNPTNPKYAPQTLTLLDANNSPTPEAYHYCYDTQGRLFQAAFAQTPQSGFNPGSGNPFYDSSHEAQTRARTVYTYDSMGRVDETATYWDTWTGSDFSSSQAVLANSCSYELATGPNRGVKTSSTFYAPASPGSTDFAAQWTESYGYDPNLDYLTSFSTTDGLANSSQTWSYDAAGNRNDTVADNLNRPTSIGGTAVTSDILGNRLTFGSQSYGWDDLNRMTSYTNGGLTTNYAYRADGMRVSKTTGRNYTNYFYDGQTTYADVDVAWTGQVYESVETDYAIGARGIDAIFKNGATAYPIYDAHGNMVATLSKVGSTFQLSNQRSYDAWGATRLGATAGDPKGRYCASLGHKQDDESGLVYMRARYYEPASGRFLSEDPSRNGSNWFGYCGNDPVNRVDSAGRYWFFVIFAIAFIGGVLAYLGYNACAGEQSNWIDALGAGLVTGIGTVFGVALAGTFCAEAAFQVFLGAMFGVGVSGGIGTAMSKLKEAVDGMSGSTLGKAILGIEGEQLWAAEMLNDMDSD